MKIRGDQLSATLAGRPAPLYWVAGDEVLLAREAADEVRGHWRAAGFIEREVFYVEKEKRGSGRRRDAAPQARDKPSGERAKPAQANRDVFTWSDFLYELDATSLFAARKLIELRLAEAKLSDEGRKAIAVYLDRAPEDFRVLITGPRIDKSTLSTQWFKKLESKMVFVQIWPIDRARLPAWLRQRLSAAGIQADNEAVQVLTDRVEGNLLAADQEIKKLALLAGAKPGAGTRLAGGDVLRLVSDSSRFDVGKLIDAALKSESARAQRVLGGLRAEGVHELLILTVLTRELRQLLEIREQIDQGREIGAAMSAARVWPSRKPLLSLALKRLSAENAQLMLEHCKLIDHAVKGLHRANPWDELSLLLLRLCG